MITPQLRATLLQLKQQPDIKCDIPALLLPLEPHQRVGVAFECLAKRSLNLDFLGAGKTVMTIAMIAKLLETFRIQRTLIICQGGKRWDWQAELKRFTNQTAIIIDGDKRTRMNAWLASQPDASVTIAHYESVRSDMLDVHEVKTGGREKSHKVYNPSALLRMLKFDFIVFDEVTSFKTPNTTLHKALEALVDTANPEYRLGLSATVIQKTLTDLHSVMDIINPGLLGTRMEFEDRYVIKQMFSTFNGRRKMRFEKVIGTKNEEELAQIMAPYFIRREKEQVYAGKLKHVAKIRRVELTPPQLAAYKKVTASVE